MQRETIASSRSSMRLVVRNNRPLKYSSTRRKTPTTAFICGDASHEIEQRLRERGVVASARGPVIRLAPHFYSSLEDVDHALDALASEVRA